MKKVDGLLEEHGRSKIEVYVDWENGNYVPKEVFEAMKPFYLEKGFANPAITHRLGWETYELYVEIKEKLVQPLNISPQDFYITHGLTESNNIAIRGVAKANKKRKKIITSSVEHLSIIHSSRYMKSQGYKIEEIPVYSNGTIDLDSLQNMIDEETLLVSVQLANHEIGSIQPLREVIEIVKDKNKETLVHSDMSAAFGRMKINLNELEIDLATFDSSRVLGPKGIGGLFVKEGVHVKPLLEGQLSVETLSPGVEIMPLIAGFAKTIELEFENFDEKIKNLINLRNKLLYGLYTTIPKTLINGAEGEKRIADNVNLSFLGCEGEALTVECSMNGIYTSSGSACSSRILMPSHILTAIGRRPEEAHGSLLMKLSRLNTEKQIEYILETMPKVVSRLRKITGSIEL